MKYPGRVKIGDLMFDVEGGRQEAVSVHGEIMEYLRIASADATKKERERCVRIIRDACHYAGKTAQREVTWQDIINAILNPDDKEPTK